MYILFLIDNYYSIEYINYRPSASCAHLASEYFILREVERRHELVKDLCKRHDISEQSSHRWRNKFGGMVVTDARRLNDLELENERLKRLIARQMLDIAGLKEFSRKNEHLNALKVLTRRGYRNAR